MPQKDGKFQTSFEVLITKRNSVEKVPIAKFPQHDEASKAYRILNLISTFHINSCFQDRYFRITIHTYIQTKLTSVNAKACMTAILFSQTHFPSHIS